MLGHADGTTEKKERWTYEKFLPSFNNRLSVVRQIKVDTTRRIHQTPSPRFAPDRYVSKAWTAPIADVHYEVPGG
jgi:hypothetical protein